jgi:hypothetical protein
MNPTRQSIEQLTVIDMRGGAVFVPQDKSDEKVTIDFTGIPAGIYVMNIRTGTNVYYIKVSRR